jgi:hypothetical protein
MNDLFVVDYSGCYHSSDTGHSWQFLCGVPTYDIEAGDRFWVSGRKVFIPTVHFDQTGLANDTAQIWMLDLDSMQYFDAGIDLRFADTSKKILKHSGDTVGITVRSLHPRDIDPNVSFDTVFLRLHYDASILTAGLPQPPSGWEIMETPIDDSTFDLTLIDSSHVALDSLGSILSLVFQSSPALSNDSIAKIYLDSVRVSGHRNNCDCLAVSSGAPDSVEVDFYNSTGCGTDLLRQLMAGDSLLLRIQSITPNPAASELHVTISGGGSYSYALYDALGTARLRGNCANDLTLDVSTLPSGVYYLEIRGKGSTYGAGRATREFVKE